MVVRTKRGATRKPVRKQHQPIMWQRLLRHIMISISLLFMVGLAVFFQQDDTLPILHVSVEGNFKQISKEELISAVNLYVKGGFLSVDVDGIQSAGEKLPWVKHVQVRKIWPDRLHLIVDEQVPVARWDKHSLLNQKGEIFSPKDRKGTGDLAQLDGPNKSYGVVTKRYLLMGGELKKYGLKIQQLSLDKRGAWRITLSNGVKVILGRTQSKQRFKRFLHIYKSSLEPYQTQIAEMDMRYPNGLSVVWKQGQKPDFNGIV